jgi:hypothetical protein
MDFLCLQNVPNSRHIQLQEEGKVGCLCAARNTWLTTASSADVRRNLDWPKT